MIKQYIKMNNNDDHLSLGNLFRIIKELSKNKYSALQSEIFCTLFDIESINETTVNNYCVGCRSIGSEYKQIFINKQKRLLNNEDEFANNIIGLLSIIDGKIYVLENNKIEFINNNNSMKILCERLYNLAKNDKSVTKEFSLNIYKYLSNLNYYMALVELLIFIVLEKKQPVSEIDLKKDVLNNILKDTSISSIDLQSYLSLKLNEGINYEYSLKKMAHDGNAYANYELGMNEYYGYVASIPRYDIAYKYFLNASNCNHQGSYYMLGNLYINGYIGSKSHNELKKGYEYLTKAMNLGNVAALNSIGNMYLKGIYPLTKDEEKAIYYYKKASLNNYAYAYNNLGKIMEERKNYKEALNYYLQSANLGESWACNKVGEYYRNGIVKKDMKLAYEYYNKALDSNYKTLCYYAYYNLAKYFYLNGYDDIVLVSDNSISISYLEIASNNGIFEALIELLFLYISKYLTNKNKEDYNQIIKYKEKIENDSRYNDQLRIKIEKELNKIKEHKKINIDNIF